MQSKDVDNVDMSEGREEGRLGTCKDYVCMYGVEGVGGEL